MREKEIATNKLIVFNMVSLIIDTLPLLSLLKLGNKSLLRCEHSVFVDVGRKPGSLFSPKVYLLSFEASLPEHNTGS